MLLVFLLLVVVFFCHFLFFFYNHLCFVILFSVFVVKTLLCCGSIVKHRRANVADERARTEEALSSFELRKVALSLFQTLPLNMLRASMQRRKHTQPDLSLNMHTQCREIEETSRHTQSRHFSVLFPLLANKFKT